MYVYFTYYFGLDIPLYVARMIKSLHYESVFTEHIARLVKNRKDLELALQVSYGSRNEL